MVELVLNHEHIRRDEADKAERAAEVEGLLEVGVRCGGGDAEGVYQPAEKGDGQVRGEEVGFVEAVV